MVEWLCVSRKEQRASSIRRLELMVRTNPKKATREAASGTKRCRESRCWGFRKKGRGRRGGCRCTGCWRSISDLSIIQELNNNFTRIRQRLNKNYLRIRQKSSKNYYKWKLYENNTTMILEFFFKKELIFKKKMIFQKLRKELKVLCKIKQCQLTIISVFWQFLTTVQRRAQIPHLDLHSDEKLCR